MSGLKRYEDELSKRLKELSSPNKALVWEKIEKMLDEDDDTVPIAPLPNNSNNLWKLLVFSILILSGLVYYLHYASTNNSNSKSNKDEIIVSKNDSVKMEIAGDSLHSHVKNNTDSFIQNQQSSISNLIIDSNNSSRKYSFQKTSSKTGNKKSAWNAINQANDNPQLSNEQKFANKNLVVTNKAKIKSNVTNGDVEEVASQAKEPILSDTNYISSKISKALSTDNTIKKDTSTIKLTTNTAHDSLITGKKKNEDRKKKWYLAAGLSIQQLIRLNYDLVYPSDTYSSVSGIDYLPSVYLRLYNFKKWFIQSEFKYAAPQNIEEFIYKVNVQSEPFKDIVTSYILKEVKNSQLSASFHYFILPNWSIGSGIIYNIFSGAEIEKDVHQKEYESANDSLLGSVSITDKNDSNFSSYMKNNFQWLWETQYKWKHISVGIKYAIGLQPYIKYIDPFSGLAAQKNNNSLNVFLRYELWNSKKDKK